MSPCLIHYLAAACTALSALGGSQPPSSEVSRKTVQWDRSTLVQLVSGGHQCYPRMVRLQNGAILFSHESLGRAVVRRSADNGMTWGEAVAAASSPYGTTANPELLQLSSGTILLLYNVRPSDGTHPFSIWVARSSDNGATWSGHTQVYAADILPENGCWEPAAVQLPSGEVQLFFANESPYRSSSEQEITLLRSFDNGLTWSQPRTVSFRAGHRDGMPVPQVLRDNRGLVIAIEDNGLHGAFKPAIVYSSMADSWQQPYAGVDSLRRWGALRVPLPASDYAGAPCIRQMPSGETILSFQHTDSGRQQPQMVVYVGDQDARNFGGRSVPFDVQPDQGGRWNSLFVKDDQTITALSGCNGGIWAIDGRIVPLDCASAAEAKALADDTPAGMESRFPKPESGEKGTSPPAPSVMLD